MGASARRSERVGVSHGPRRRSGGTDLGGWNEHAGQIEVARLIVGERDLTLVSARLVGRARECARIDGLLAAARRGQSGSLVVRGEAGMGNTALLRYGTDRAREMRLLQVTGVEAGPLLEAGERRHGKRLAPEYASRLLPAPA